MLHRILVPLDVSPGTASAIRLAASIAKQLRQDGRANVMLEGLGIVDTDQIPRGRFAAVASPDEMLENARAKARELVADFHKLALAEGLDEARLEERVSEGSPTTVIAHHHVFADMVVMTDTCSFPPVTRDYETLVHLMFESSRPILVVPEEATAVKEVLMVMDGTATSSRMMYAYVHLNPFPKAKVTVVRSTYEEQHHNLKDFFLRMERYMAGFGIEIKHTRVDGHMMEQLPDLIEREKTDLVAVGLHREHLLHKFAAPLHLVDMPVEELMRRTGVSLFTVH